VKVPVLKPAAPGVPTTVQAKSASVALAEQEKADVADATDVVERVRLKLAPPVRSLVVLVRKNWMAL
jgi:hypothetical protein